MDATEIKLKINTNDIREIYFRNNRQKLFFGPDTKRQSFYLTVALLIFPFFTYCTLKFDKSEYLIFGTLIFIAIIYEFWNTISPIIKWKKSVLTFIESTSKINTLKLTYNDTYFIHTQDNHELKHDWSLIERAEINPRFIWLFSNTDILLPKSSMAETEFTDLCTIIMDKVKNVEKE